MSKRQGFVIYHEDMQVCELLTNEQLGVLVRMLWDHSEDKPVEPEGDLMRAMYAFMAQKIDRDEGKYQRVSKARSDAAKKRKEESK